ncbi:MAG: hypothetical protein KJO40_14605 [Deltaproteobacteria bacterium]|nr:hypothetical protein [Deltaproteobacteria bacterium]MBT8464313.1 hypothetical protein [Deltaproteobacteria bacterium]NNK09165.1 hypothetical protein [Myxococcales bacterium]RZV49285.1 MAG: hypothetical protein EX268_19195 [Deltaproteobacteria bacterium]
MKHMSDLLPFVALVALVAACGGAGDSPAQKCDASSTYALVQSIFEARGCTAGLCHGEATEGGLDLRPASAYENLIHIPGTSADLRRVFPGEEEISLLYLKLAAKTDGIDLGALGIAGSPMPIAGAALADDELALIRAWIRGGAPERGVVAGALGALGCEANDADVLPNKIPPLPAPADDEGVQMYSGAWSLPSESEDEVCFVTYYDFTDQIPDSQKIPCPELYGGAERECFTYKEVLIAQDPQSHHAVIEGYIPPEDTPEQWEPTSEVWKNWICLGGENDGVDCDPLDIGGCGERSACATRPETAVACTGYPNGPREMGTIDGFFGNAAGRKNIAFSQEPTFRESFVDGVYGVVPVKGFTIWNSHSFNLTKHDTSIEQYMNFKFRESDGRLYQRQHLIVFDAIFAMGVIAPFASTEVCATFTAPRGAHLLNLTSHTHQHGRDFRIWYPPNDPCSAGTDCKPPTDREPNYRSFVYDDPLNQIFGEGNTFALNGSEDSERTFRYCAIFDNGEADPMTVRRNSNRPDAVTCEFAEAAGGFIANCGCTPEERECLGGESQGMLCGDDDGVCGAGGICDACPLAGGVTTEDEMFAVLASYYLVPPTQ